MKTNPSSSSKASSVPASAARAQYLYLTTRGRKSGQPREIEIWFVLHDGDFFVIAEYVTSNWLKNLQAHPAVQVRVEQTTFAAQAQVLSSDSERAATVSALFREKYGWGDGVVVQLSPQITDTK